MDQKLLRSGRGGMELLARNAVDGLIWLERRSWDQDRSVPSRKARHHIAGGRFYG